MWDGGIQILIAIWHLPMATVNHQLCVIFLLLSLWLRLSNNQSVSNRWRQERERGKRERERNKREQERNNLSLL